MMIRKSADGAKAVRGGASPASLAPRHMLEAKECALLVRRLIEVKAEGATKPLSRFRVAELSLRRMWGRQRLTQDFIGEVNEWLFRSGWVLFFAGNSYGLISVDVVEGWSRLTSKLISAETSQALAGRYDFTALEELLTVKEDVGEDGS